MQGQQRLPPPVLPDRPRLPDLFTGHRQATHRQHKVQQRNMCTICVWLLYHDGGTWAPLHARWMRVGSESAPRGTPDAIALLCQQHHLEWSERDKAAKQSWKDEQ